MNKVDFLLEHPFSLLRDEEKKNVKDLGPHRPNICLVQKHKNQSRTFNAEWYRKISWLTGSESKHTLFCFYCLLFGGDVSWTLHGIRDLKHLSERIKSHEQTSRHMSNCVKFKLFGKVDIRTQLDEGYKHSVRVHNELVDKNRYVLNRIIDCLKFCGSNELALRSHNESEDSLNRGVFLNLVSEIAKLDSQLNEHLENSKISKYTSATIQNELLDCIYDVYRDCLQEVVNAAMFVSVQADETTDISNKSQLVVILRFVHGTKVVEHFHTFSQIKDRSAAGISSRILQELQPYNLKDKLISQTYDGAAVMRGELGGVQKLVRDIYPHAYFLHCYAHQLNLIMQQVCSTVTPVRIFFANLTAFSSFFSTSSKRTDLLQEACQRRLPRAVITRWNFQSRAVQAVYHAKESLMTCFERIREEPGWDAVSIREASGLIKFLEDTEFLFFLKIFSEIMPHIDIFYNILQKKISTSVSVSHHLQNFQKSVHDIRCKMSETSVNVDLSFGPKRRKQDNITACAVECCDLISNQAQHRFGAVAHLECFNLVDPVKFPEFEKKFPCDAVRSCTNFYPFINSEKLQTELKVLYSSEEFKDSKSIGNLYSFLTENDLQTDFSEAIKILNIALTSPIVTAESERCFSTLKRVKTCLRNTMGQERLNALTVLSVEKKFISEIDNFNTKVIHKFAEQKNRRAQFLYK